MYGVCSETVLAAGEYSDMQVVDADDAVHPEDDLIDLADIHTPAKHRRQPGDQRHRRLPARRQQSWQGAASTATSEQIAPTQPACR